MSSPQSSEANPDSSSASGQSVAGVSGLSGVSGGGFVSEMPKGYVPSEHEGRIRELWQSTHAWRADGMRVVRGEAKPYAVFIPPPNVTAALHLGHALNNTLQDVLVRSARMKGLETLWMPGTDHAGIATQAVVEKRVQKEEGKRRKDFGREEFVAKIQAFKDEYERTITGQLVAMGCSCDWDRQRFTMDGQCVAAVYEAFYRLFRDGLIYRGKRLVNWDPALQTAVADDECYDEEVETSFWYLRYPLTEKMTLDDGTVLDSVTVATTRPETYLGDTAVAMNPRDPRARALQGKRVRLPLVGREIPIVLDDYVVLPEAMASTEEEKNDPKAKFATGFLKVTPAHDQNDAEIGQRHGLAAINMMSPDGRVSDKHGWSDVGQAGKFVGMTMANARKEVVAAFKELGLLAEVRPYRHSVKHSDRSKAVVEPYLSDQWYVKVTDERLAGAANAALVAEQRSGSSSAKGAIGDRGGAIGDGELRFTPARYAKTYENWHMNIRDWCISRQLWWGHQIPVWSSAGGTDVPLHTTLKLEPWQKAGRIHVIRVRHTLEHTFGDPQDNVTGCFVCVRDPADAEIVNELEAGGFLRDPDVLDTWFSSALWPLSTLGWPNPNAFKGNDGLLQAFNPSSVLCTAREIITLWVSRMVMFNRYFLGQDGAADGKPGPGAGRGRLPFSDVFIHAVIQDGEGRKMSKSLGNGVDPLDIIASHGSDAMRFTLVNMATQTQDVRLPVAKDNKTGKNSSPKFDAGRNFCNKLWNAARFALGMLSAAGPDEGSPVATSELAEVDRWMLSRLRFATEAADQALANYEFAEYGQVLYDLLWRDFCDWYLESIKPTVAASSGQRAVLAAALEVILRLLQPVAPFVTQAISERTASLRTRSVVGITLAPASRPGVFATAGWPAVSAALRDERAEAHFRMAQDLAGSINAARATHNVPPKRKVTLIAPAGVVAELGDLRPVVMTMCQLGAVHESGAGAQAGPAVSIAFGAAELKLTDLADATAEGAPGGGVDVGAERERLGKLIAEKTKAAGIIDARLSNPGYADKAPAKLVEQSKNELAKLRAEIAAAEAALAAIR